MKENGTVNEFCGEVVYVLRGIIVFSQFIVNSGFWYNLSIVISIFIIVD